MENILVKPYEVSIWDEQIVENESSLKQVKIAVIGSDSLKAPNMAYNIVFHKDKNGEKTLSFCIKYKYLNPNTGCIEENPFVPYLINERKVKLFYENEWYDFIIKEVEETDEEYEWSYIAQDAFVLELSKNGYNVEFNNELNNNLGTAQQLASRALEDTDWEVIDIDIGEPQINEPVYKGKLQQQITVKDMSTDEDVELSPVDGQEYDVLIFYSFIANKNGKFLQFIKAKSNDSDYEIDSTNNIIALNYRFNEEVIINDINQTISNTNGDILINYSSIYTEHEVYRTIYQQLTTYDPIMEKVVDEYEGGGLTVYHYTDSIYTTSNVVISYIANGDKFNTYDNGTLMGWDKNVLNSAAEITLSTYPNIDYKHPIADLTHVQTLEGYLQVKFGDNNTYTDSYIYNNGIQTHTSLIHSILKDDEFVFRWRAGKTNTEHGQPLKLVGNEIGAKVAFYEEILDTSESNSRYVKKITDTILDFKPDENNYPVLNNIIYGGELVTITTEVENDVTEQRTAYMLNGIEQIPSTKYLYNNSKDNKDYYWSVYNQEYVEYDIEDNTFLDYYYLTAKAKTSVTPKQFEDSSINIGIFIYCLNSPESYYYFNDIQLTRLYKDETDNIVTIGNVPKATARITNYYYVPPKTLDEKNKVSVYLDLSALEQDYNLSEGTLQPVYNQGSALFLDSNADVFRVRRKLLQQIYDQFHVRGYALNKVSSIEAAQSNYFDILQTIAETFECWIDIYVEHNEDGSLFVDDEGNLIKTIFLRRFCGKDNFAGFKYAINLSNISRTLDSNDIVTKLIVNQTQSDLVDSGNISISRAESNYNKESYILNFDYFLNQGLLNREQFMPELQAFNETINTINSALEVLEGKAADLFNSLVKIESNRNVYNALLTEAHQQYNKSLDEFEKLTSETYAEYCQRTEDEEDSDLLKIDKIIETIGKIYTYGAVDNSYRGLYANIDNEYISLHKELYGITEHVVTVSRVKDATNDNIYYVRLTLDDYITPFKFDLGGNTYETSLSTKSFDIETQATEITNIIYNTSDDTGYVLVDAEGHQVDTIQANESQIQTFVLVPNTAVDGILTLIDEAIQLKKEKIREFNIKYGRFILEGTWSSQEYLSDELYYLDATVVGKNAAFPKVTYNINVVDISGIEEFSIYDFNAGEKTYVEDTEFFGWIEKDGVKTPAREEVIISEIDRYLDDPSQNSITVQNYKDHFEDLFQRLQATVQTVEYNEVTYPKTNSILDEQKTINQKLLLESLSQIAGLQRPLTTDGSIVIKGDVIEITNLLNRLNMVKLSSDGISISRDGGKVWTAAVTGEGINIGEVISDFIDTKQIWIGSRDNPSYRWDSNGLSAFTLNEIDNTYNFKRFVRFDQYGLYGIDLDSVLNENDYDYVVHGLDDIKNDANFAITWDGFFIKNKYNNGYVSISSDNDIQVMQLDKTYTEVVDVEGKDPSEQGWYELEAGNYIKTKDKTPQQGKTYYSRAVEETEAIKIGALDFDVQTHKPTKYGIRINNNEGNPVFVTGSDGNLAITNTVRVGTTDVTNGHTHIVIDGEQANIHSSNYQNSASSGWMINKDGDAYFNNITARGAIKTAVFEYSEIQAVGGVFLFRPSSVIKKARLEYAPTSDENPQQGKTYYEYHNDTNSYEIISVIDPQANPQELGWYEQTNNLILKVEKPLLFANTTYNRIIEINPGDNPQQLEWYERTNYGYIETIDIQVVPDKAYYSKNMATTESWCKISNYVTDGIAEDPTIQNTLLTNGLTHVYKIIDINLESQEVILENGYIFINAVKQEGQTDDDILLELEGGTLVDLGREDRSSNYGIGINSSDNTVNLPARAISLFETTIDSTKDVKVSYEYKGILGTLPTINLTSHRVETVILNANTITIYTISEPSGEVEVAVSDNEVIYEVNGNTYSFNNVTNIEQTATLIYDVWANSESKGQFIYNKVKDSQGIFTNNLYIGDADHYMAFYTDLEDNNRKKFNFYTDQITILSGTPNNTNFLYLGTEDYTGSTITINGNSTEWREIIGTNFGVNSNGNLYTNNAYINGTIDATSFQARDPNNQVRTIVNGNGVSFNDEDGNSIAVFNNGLSIYDNSLRYVRTHDISIDSNKDYYIKDSEIDQYELVDEPNIEDINNYYELISHRQIAYYGEEVKIGNDENDDEYNMLLNGENLLFRRGNTPIATYGASIILGINDTTIIDNNSLDSDTIRFKELQPKGVTLVLEARANGHFSIKPFKGE